MAEKIKNEVPVPWNKHLFKKRENVLYSFPKIIEAPSIFAKEQKGEEKEEVRKFKNARLVEVDRREKEYCFVGYEVIKKSESEYEINDVGEFFFIIPFAEMRELTK